MRQWWVLSAILVSVLLIVGAYFLASGSLNAHRVDASSTDSLLQSIASRDSDHDGLPDWEEVLYGTNPHKADTRGLGMTDGEAVAKGLIVPKATANISTQTGQNSSVDSTLPNAPAEGTLTAAFAQNLFKLYMSAKQQNGGAPLSQKTIQNIALQAVDQLSKSITLKSDFKTLSDLHVSDSGDTALKTFAASADTVFRVNPSGAKQNELDYLKDALASSTSVTDVKSDLKNIASISVMYKNIASGLSILPVPKEMTKADLGLINALAHIGDVIGDFTRINSDPITSIIAIKQYALAVQNLGQAFVNVHMVYADRHITIQPNKLGAMFINFSNEIVPAKQPQTNKTL